MINNEEFGRKRKIFNQMNIIIKIKDFLRNLIKIIKNMITKNLIKRKQNVLNVVNMVILPMTVKLNDLFILLLLKITRYFILSSSKFGLIHSQKNLSQ